MSLVAELATQAGVVGAGEYSYRGDRFTFKGELSDEQARMASIMCRATTMSVHMQAGILEQFCQDCGLAPSIGWVVRGEQLTVVAYGNFFCLLDNTANALNRVTALLRERLGDPGDALI